LADIQNITTRSNKMVKDSIIGKFLDSRRTEAILVSLLIVLFLIQTMGIIGKQSNIARASTAEPIVQKNGISIRQNEKTFSGQIASEPVTLSGNFCIVGVTPLGAKDAIAYPAMIDCGVYPKIGERVIVKDFQISAPHHLPDMVHIAERIK